MERVSLEDERVIAFQIGRAPRGLSAVARRCSHGFPQAIRVHPIVDGAPFPTLYWLTCPFLGRKIDRLESGGWVGRFEDRLAADSGLLAEYRVATAEYVRERKALLSRAEREIVNDRGWEESLYRHGIGGIAESARVKCLHAHVAHALATGNPVGSLVLEMFDRTECAEKEVICSARERAEQIDQINR